jgi:hypothetical protein
MVSAAHSEKFASKTGRREFAPFTQKPLGGTLGAPEEFSTFYGFASVTELGSYFF